MSPLVFRRMFAMQIDVIIGAIPLVGCIIITENIKNTFVCNIIRFVGFVATIILCFFKDYFGRGLGKRALGLKIVDSRTGVLSVGMKNVLRNILLVIWPIEFICLLFSKSYRRIMDRVLNLDVISSESDE